MTSSRTTTRFAKAAALVGAGALGATIVTGVAFAADPTPSPSASSSTGTGDGTGPMSREGRGDHGGRGGPGAMGFGGEVLHGDATVETADGTTEVMRVVRGSVTAISDTSITVKATDGFTQTFAITTDTDIHKSRSDATAADIAVGDVAMVSGVVSGDTVTAKRVHAMTAAEEAQMQTMRDQRQAEQDAASTASPAPTAAS